MKTLQRFLKALAGLLARIIDYLVQLLSPISTQLFSGLLGIVVISPFFAFIRSCHKQQETIIEPQETVFAQFVNKVNTTKESINKDRLTFYLDSFSKSEYKGLIAFEDEVLSYIDDLEDFCGLDTIHDKIKNDSTNEFDSYIKSGLNLYASKVSLIKEIRPVIVNNNKKASKKIEALNDNMLEWRDGFLQAWKDFDAFRDSMKVVENDRICKSGEASMDSISAVSTDSISIKMEMFHQSQAWIKAGWNIIEKFRSDQFFEIECGFLDIVTDYDEMMKTRFLQEKWRSMTTLE